MYMCAVLLCLVVCLTLLASFFLPSHLSLKHVLTLFGVWCLLVVSLSRPSPSYRVKSKPVHQVYYEMWDLGPATCAALVAQW